MTKSANPLAAVCAAGLDHPLLEEDRETWTLGRLLSLAGEIGRRVPDDEDRMLPVRAQSAAFVLASLFGAWSRRRYPLLVDPALVSGCAGTAGVADRFVGPPPADGVATGIAVRETGAPPLAPVFPAPRDPEVAFFTSGSTGEPKVVLKRAYQLQEQFAVEPAWLGLSGPISVLCLVPPFHILGYIYGLYLPVATGGRISFLRGGTPQAWIAAISRLTPHLVVGVPAHYRLMSQALDSPLPAALYLSSGGPLHPDVAADFRARAGSSLVEVYGSTETGGIATRSNTAAWTPFPGLRWESREDDGRLVIASAWQEKPGEWYCTDDVVEADGEGFRLLGRADSIVKIGGRRMSTGEVTQAALSHPGVEQAHAVAYGRYGELAVALFAVPARGVELTASDLRTFLCGRLPAFKVPRTVRVVAALPSRGIGKADEQALRRLAGAGPSPAPARGPNPSSARP